MSTYPLLLVFPIAMIAAAAWDVATMRIPNKISLFLLAAFLIVTPLSGVSWSVVQAHLFAGFVVLLIGFVMFTRGWLGGGDAKLLAAAALWIGSEQLLAFVFTVGVFGGLLCLVILALRRLPDDWMTTPAWLSRLRDKSVGAPYGVAIGAGALFVYPQTPYFLAFMS